MTASTSRLAVRSIPFAVMHLAILTVFLVPFRWELLALCALTYGVRMFGITGGYHRYFSHRSFHANRIIQFALAWIGSSAVQKGVLWWAANHRHHHKHSDRAKDIHSPVQRGFWWSHVGWILSDKHDATLWDQIPDLAKYPELRWLNRYHLVPAIALGVTLFVIGGWAAVVWGFVVSTVLCWHGTFFINSLAHVFGSQRYKTTDTSRNNLWLAVLTLGEGWHNNHHCYQSSTRQGFFWWEVDLTYYTLKAGSWFGLVSKLREPPLKLLENRRLRNRNASVDSEQGAPLSVG